MLQKFLRLITLKYFQSDISEQSDSASDTESVLEQATAYQHLCSTLKNVGADESESESESELEGKAEDEDDERKEEEVEVPDVDSEVDDENGQGEGGTVPIVSIA